MTAIVNLDLAILIVGAWLALVALYLLFFTGAKKLDRPDLNTSEPWLEDSPSIDSDTKRRALAAHRGMEHARRAKERSARYGRAA